MPRLSNYVEESGVWWPTGVRWAKRREFEIVKARDIRSIVSVVTC